MAWFVQVLYIKAHFYYFCHPMKNWLSFLIIIPLGFSLMTTVISCQNADAQSLHIAKSDVQSDSHRPPGPDGNPATYDENPNNPPKSTVRTYINTDGKEVQSPTKYISPPPGACAICKDGTYSQSKHRKGTCSHHGGVREWLVNLP